MFNSICQLGLKTNPGLSQSNFVEFLVVEDKTEWPLICPAAGLTQNMPCFTDLCAGWQSLPSSKCFIITNLVPALHCICYSTFQEHFARHKKNNLNMF